DRLHATAAPVHRWQETQDKGKKKWGGHRGPPLQDISLIRRPMVQVILEFLSYRLRAAKCAFDLIGTIDELAGLSGCQFLAGLSLHQANERGHGITGGRGVGGAQRRKRILQRGYQSALGAASQTKATDECDEVVDLADGRIRELECECIHVPVG